MTLKNDSPFKAVTGLGQFQKEFAQGAFGGCVYITLGLALAAAGLALALLTATGLKSGAVARDQTLLMLAFAGMLFVIGVGLLVWTFLAGGQSAALFEQGVALSTGKGVRSVAWADIAAVYVRVVKLQRFFITYATSYYYTVETTAGDKLVFDNGLGREVNKLGNAIQIAVAKTHFPRYWEAYQQNQVVKFGPLALDRQKLIVNKKELSWPEVSSVKIENGSVWVEKAGKGWLRWTTVAVPQVPNILIFNELVHRIKEGS